MHNLKQYIQDQGILVAPGVYDGLSALLQKKLVFQYFMPVVVLLHVVKVILILAY